MTDEHRDSTAGAATYVFCVVQAARAPSLRSAPSSLPGAGPVRLLEVDRGLWAVVSHAPLSRFSPERIESHLNDLEQISKYALAHASVIEFFFQRAPVIPLKLFTLFSSDDRAMKHLHARRASIRSLLMQVKGREEWGVRVTIVPGARPGDASARTRASGRAYLQTKKQQRDRLRAAPAGAARSAASILRALGTLASSVSLQNYPAPSRGRPLVVGASFLVPVARRSAWQARVARAADGLSAAGSQLEVNGPWPPYHFVTRPRRKR